MESLTEFMNLSNFLSRVLHPTSTIDESLQEGVGENRSFCSLFLL